MKSLARNVAAVIIGFLLGSVVNMAIITVGMMIIPPPAGMDMSNAQAMSENMKLLRTEHFIAPWLAHAAGTFVGAWLAARIAAHSPMVCATVIGVLFLLGGVAMVAMVGGPLWFIVIDLVGAYLPMSTLGGRLGRRTDA